MRMRRRTREHTPVDDDAIWRGEVPDHLVIMTAAERRRIDAERREQDRRRTLVELFGEPVGSLAAEPDAVHHRRRGDAMRNGDMVDQRRAAGCLEEIQVSVLAHPVDAVEYIADHELLDGIGSLVVDPSSEERADKQIAWNAGLRTTPWSQRAARLRLYGSPSANVTVITLTPCRSRRFGVRLFLRSGLRVLFELQEQVEQGLAHSGRT